MTEQEQIALLKEHIQSLKDLVSIKDQIISSLQLKSALSFPQWPLLQPQPMLIPNIPVMPIYQPSIVSDISAGEYNTGSIGVKLG